MAEALLERRSSRGSSADPVKHGESSEQDDDWDPEVNVSKNLRSRCSRMDRGMVFGKSGLLSSTPYFPKRIRAFPVSGHLRKYEVGGDTVFTAGVGGSFRSRTNPVLHKFAGASSGRV